MTGPGGSSEYSIYYHQVNIVTRGQTLEEYEDVDHNKSALNTIPKYSEAISGEHFTLLFPRTRTLELTEKQTCNYRFPPGEYPFQHLQAPVKPSLADFRT